MRSVRQRIGAGVKVAAAVAPCRRAATLIVDRMADSDGDIEALIHPSEDGGFWAEVAGVAGCITQGETYSEILERLRDAHDLRGAVAGGAPRGPAPACLGEVADVAGLIDALRSAGWEQSERAGQHHLLFLQPGGTVALCVPAARSERLNAGFREALQSFFGG